MKKILSLFLALTLAVSGLGTGITVFAENEAINAQFSVYDGEFVKEPTTIKVTADLSDKYGFTDNESKPTILDATVAAHLEMFGNTDGLSISESGWTTSVFGKDASTFSYRLSGNFANGMSDKISDGDYIEYMFFSDTVGWSDTYTFFDARNKDAFRNESITLTLSKEGYDENWAPVIVPAANADITVNGIEFGKTDSNGNITLSFDKVGTYNISAKNNIDSTPIFAPWCTVNVSNTKLFNYVEKETNGAAAYLLKDVKALDVNSAVDYLKYLKSGYDMSKYNNAFLASVKANLDENSGKLSTAPVSGYKSEMGNYGAVIQILNILGENAEDFEGYNLYEALKNIDLNESYHPYYYRVAIEAADEAFAKTLCDNLISKYYVKGSGLNYWGFSCDNTAHFLTSISKYKDAYKEYVDDAKKVIKTYTKENGAYADNTYVPYVNPDSTALAMMAFASVGDVETAFTYYKNLVESFEGKTGIILYNGEENLIATKDALLSLEYFKNEIEAKGFEHPEDVIKTTTVKATTKKSGSITKTCVICGKSTKTTIYYPKTVTLSTTTYTYNGNEKKPSVTVKNSKGKTISKSNYTVKYSNNKKVGKATVKLTFKGNYSGNITKTFVIKPKKTKLTSVKAGKKSITVKWNKQTNQTNGYQLQLATNKSFTKNKKLINISKNKTSSKKISSLKAKKKYYVRIRTYKTVDGKKYYSSWSSYKAVTTKK